MPDLQQLLRRARSDAPGLQAFFDATAHRLLTALTVLGDPTTVDDVLVATYRHVWTGDWDQPGPDGDIWTWLNRIAVIELALVRLDRRRSAGADGTDLVAGPDGSPAAVPAQTFSGLA